MYTFLCGLVFADLGYLACFVQYLYFESSLKSKCDHLYFVHQILFPTWNAFKATSDFIVICMTINRFYVMENITELRIQALRKNTNGQEKKWTIYLQLLIVVIFSFTLHLPYYFFDKIDKPTCNDNSSEVIEDPDQNPNENLRYIYFIISVGLAKLVPMLIIVTLNVALVKSLKIMARRRKKVLNVETNNMDINETRKVWSVTNKASIKEQKLAILLVFIAVSYLVFTLPADITFVLVNLDIPLIGRVHEPLIIVTNFFETLNYAANFYIYCAVHREIRQSFVDLCRAFIQLFRHE